MKGGAEEHTLQKTRFAFFFCKFVQIQQPQSLFSLIVPFPGSHQFAVYLCSRLCNRLAPFLFFALFPVASVHAALYSPFASLYFFALFFC